MPFSKVLVDFTWMRHSLEPEVVAFAVAVGLGHAETKAGGFVDKSQLGQLAAALGSGLALPGSLRAGRWSESAGSALGSAHGPRKRKAQAPFSWKRHLRLDFLVPIFRI